MIKNIKIPSSYIRGEKVIEKIGSYCVQMAKKKVFIIGGKKALNSVKDDIVNSLNKAEIEITNIKWYGGECTWNNINKLSQLVQNSQPDLLIAVGGGKALDTGKAVAFKTGLPCITVPTIAATCAAFTPLSIIHDENGVYLENTSFSACPEAIFIDTNVILKAPSKWLYAGMGDTLAKWYELRATTSNISKTSWTIGGINNGKICYKVIKEFGLEAKKAMENKEITEGLNYVIDAIVFYAGMSSILGGDQCRGAAAHSIYFGFTNIPEVHDVGHGLLVGFGNLVLLALEKRSKEEILEEMKLAKDCGIPIKFSDIDSLSEDNLMMIAKIASSANDMQNMPFDVSPAMVYEAMLLIDRLGNDYFKE